MARPEVEERVFSWRGLGASVRVGFCFTSLWRCVESTRRAGAQRSRERRALARRVKRRETHFYRRLGGRMSGCLRLGVGAARERGRPRRLRFTSRWRCVESPRRAGAQRSRERRALARRVKRGPSTFISDLADE